MKTPFLVALGLAGALLGAAGVAEAHVHNRVATKYDVIVGWKTEPTVAGYPSGLDLGVFVPPANATWSGTAEGTAPSDEGAAVTDLSDKDLAITYSYGGRTFTPPNFRANEDHGPGWYTADVIPTQPGRYTVHVTGTIAGSAVDLTVTPEDVESGTDAMFPAVQPSNYDLGQNVTQLQKDVQALKASKQTSSTPVMTSGPAGSTTPAFAVGALVGASVVAAAGVAYVRRDRVKRRER